MPRVYTKNTANKPDAKAELTTREAAEVLHRKPSFVYRKVREGMLMPIHIYGKEMVFAKRDIENFKLQHQRPWV